MSIYINIETNEYPLYEGDIRLIYPDMGQEFVLPDKFAEVLDTAPPSLDLNQTFDEGMPIFNEITGKYERSFTVRNLTEEEIAIAENYRQIYYPDYPSCLEPYEQS